MLQLILWAIYPSEGENRRVCSTIKLVDTNVTFKVAIKGQVTFKLPQTLREWDG